MATLAPVAIAAEFFGEGGGFFDVDRNFIGVDRNFIVTGSLRYCYVIEFLLLRYCYVIGRRSRVPHGVPDLRSAPLCSPLSAPVDLSIATSER